ncbi:MAG: NADP-dependent oxidoreductase [Betaproteobacteria bacterium]|jgi:NADPH:quinone reductase-like Zn-dependent oxidoreductase|nr:NADP-dependent oxidoreductase [Betaproteobacteria bacterium]
MTFPVRMRAWRVHEYGGPEVLRLDTAPVTSPGPGEVLVKVAAASINPIDWKMRNGLLRAVIQTALPRVLGRDCAGTVVAVGEGVSGLEPGTPVAGVADPVKHGTHAEYAALPASQVARVPDGVSPEVGASLCVSGLSASIPLVEDVQVSAGQRVLIHAGAGGVGSLAIQIARHLGAEVFTTCGAANRDYCLGLGASRAIDYANEDFIAIASDCDVVLDTVGGEVHVHSQKVLKPGGALVALNAAPVPSTPPRADIRIVPARIQATRVRLERLFEWSASGVLQSTVESRFPFESAPEAYRLSESGHARGKIVLTLA